LPLLTLAAFYALASGLWHHKVRETQVDVGGVSNRLSDIIPRFVCVPHSSVTPITVVSGDGGSPEDKYHQNDQSHRRDHQYCDTLAFGESPLHSSSSVTRD
jgi:hypothetical protein